MMVGTHKAMGALLLCGACLSLSATARAEEEAPTVPLAPISVDDAALSGLDLPQRDLPAHPGKEFHQKQLYRGDTLSVFVLGGETITNEISDFPIDEYVHYINGTAEIAAQDEVLTFVGGDRLVVPRGFSGRWTNRGGPRHHLELSVISTQRAKARSDRAAPFRIPREVLAGQTLTHTNTDGPARDVVYEGPELIVSVLSEAPGSRTINASATETFVQILNGSVTITPKGGQAVRYFFGDTFVLPSGFVGEWKIEGRNGLRVIEVVARDL